MPTQPIDIESEFGLLLRDLRKSIGFTQKELAGQIDGITNSDISRWEARNTFPSVPDVHKLADALSVDKKTRFEMLDKAGDEAAERLNSSDVAIARSGIKRIIGGGNMFGSLLYNLRTQQGISQKDFAIKAEVSANGLRAWEFGLRTPEDDETVRKLANALGLEEESVTRDLFFTAAQQGRNSRLCASR